MTNIFSSTDQTEVAQFSATNAPQPTVQYVLVALAGRRYGVRLDNLQEVVRYDQLSLAPLPNSPAWLDGIVSLRGNILSAVSLRAFLGITRQNDSKTPYNPGLNLRRGVARLLVVATSDQTIGVVVDDIEGVIFVQPEQIQQVNQAYWADPATKYLQGVYSDPENKSEVALLDVRRLITSAQMLKLEPAPSR